MKFLITQHNNKLFYIYEKEYLLGLPIPFSWNLVNRLSNLPHHKGGFISYQKAVAFASNYKKQIEAKKVRSKNRTKFKSYVIEL